MVTGEDWSRYGVCHICGVAARVACQFTGVGRATGLRAHPHPGRVLRMDRDPAGVLLLGRREHVTSSRPGTTHGAYVHHVAVDGASACTGALIADGTWQPLARLTLRERCKRYACKRLWTLEEVLA